MDLKKHTVAIPVNNTMRAWSPTAWDADYLRMASEVSTWCKQQGLTFDEDFRWYHNNVGKLVFEFKDEAMALQCRLAWAV